MSWYILKIVACNGPSNLESRQSSRVSSPRHQQLESPLQRPQRGMPTLDGQTKLKPDFKTSTLLQEMGFLQRQLRIQRVVLRYRL
jgi:hypothetical protein